MSYTYFILLECVKIKIYLKLGMSVRSIATRRREIQTLGAVSGREKSKVGIETFIKRKSRFYLALTIVKCSSATLMDEAIHTVH